MNELAQNDIDYADLRWALTPRSTHLEIAFLFDSTATGSDHYGFEISKAWLPALWTHRPNRTAVSHGDLIGAPSQWIWRELDTHLIRTSDFPRLSTEQYFVVYFTNVSATQLRAMDGALRGSTLSYLGHLDCSTWIPLKTVMLLPQYAIRSSDVLIVPAAEDGLPHITPPEIGCSWSSPG